MYPGRDLNPHNRNDYRILSFVIGGFIRAYKCLYGSKTLNTKQISIF
jgi:hypothetical protein